MFSLYMFLVFFCLGLFIFFSWLATSLDWLLWAREVRRNPDGDHGTRRHLDRIFWPLAWIALGFCGLFLLYAWSASHTTVHPVFISLLICLAVGASWYFFGILEERAIPNDARVHRHYWHEGSH